MKKISKRKPNTQSSPSIIIRPKAVTKTEAFDTFWRFATARQEVFFARVNGQKQPWTNDPILQTFKFTNAYRASDRVSQFLIREVISKGSQAPDELFFRIILFKLFNKIETWQLLCENVNFPSLETYSYRLYDEVLSAAMARGVSIYSAAYIMASGAAMFGLERKHQGHLRLIEMMLTKRIPELIFESRSMKQGFQILRDIPLIGDFLAYQLITDLNYSNLTNYSEMEFTMPGPGARDGIRKCFSDLGGLSESAIIFHMANIQDREFDRLGLNFKRLWGRELQLIDIQNLFCEVDKYCRVFHPEIQGISGRSRIKQKFIASTTPFTYVYPEKWGLQISGAACNAVGQNRLF